MVITEHELDIDGQLLTNISTRKPENVILIDIETLGFSAKFHMIYMIGAIFMEDGQLLYKQWFAEKEEDEYQLLFEFAKLLKHFTDIVHFNGKLFDVPFIIDRMALYKINHHLEDMTQHDIYLDLKTIREYLNLPNLKLKTVEAFFGIHRKDPYTGGELIAIYKHYVKNPDHETKEVLMLHNKEDLIALYHCLHSYELIHYFKSLGSLKPSKIKDVFVNKDYMIIDINMKADFEMRIDMPYYHMFINRHMLSISIPILTDELKLFIEDYENYFYLTKEDYAVHKSIGKLVDPKYRKRAKKSNCYAKKQSTFIPLLTKPLEGDKIFYKQYRSKPGYIELNDHFLKESGRLNTYIMDLLKSL